MALRSIGVTLLALCGFIPAIAFAATNSTVQSLQMPAWVIKNDIKKALKPGDIISSGDRVITGKNARIHVRLAEESVVKLGEQGEINFNNLEIIVKEDKFDGLIDVLNGAFRYTTTKLGERFSRKIDFRIRAISAGIRGTDIWGRSTDEENLLCLIEGEIIAQHKDKPEFKMDKPLSYFALTPTQPEPNVVTVDEQTLAKWAAETDTHEGEGVLSIVGEWAVNLMSAKDKTSLSNIIKRLDDAGYGTTIEQADVKGSTWYRVQVRGFDSRPDAKYFARSISGQFGIAQPWVIKFQ